MKPLKAPGPDRLHALFFQRTWHLIGEEMTIFLNQMWTGCLDLQSINHTFITLIPKVNDPDEVKYFRPISLCNVCYKILTKAIVIRLKSVLDSMVSYHQSAFIPGRLITDNVLIAHEIFHSMKTRLLGRKGYMALKLDMEKASDRVEWPFVQALLCKYGFHEVWVNRIIKCISSITFSIIVNNNIPAPITPTRGL